MYTSNSISTTDKLSKGNRGLKIATNFKAGAAASNPSLLNGEQKVLGNLALRSHLMIGIKPCGGMYFSM